MENENQTYEFPDIEGKKHAIECLMRVGLNLLQASQGTYLSADASGKALRFDVVAVKDGMSNLLSILSRRLQGKVVPFGQGVTGRAAVEKRGLYASRLESVDMAQVQGDGVPNAVLAVPVVKNDATVGVLTAVCFDQEKTFNETSLANYTLLAEGIAGIV